MHVAQSSLSGLSKPASVVCLICKRGSWRSSLAWDVVAGIAFSYHVSPSRATNQLTVLTPCLTQGFAAGADSPRASATRGNYFVRRSLPDWTCWQRKRLCAKHLRVPAAKLALPAGMISLKRVAAQSGLLSRVSCACLWLVSACIIQWLASMCDHLLWAC